MCRCDFVSIGDYAKTLHNPKLGLREVEACAKDGIGFHSLTTNALRLTVPYCVEFDRTLMENIIL